MSTNPYATMYHDPFPAALDNLISRARAAMLVVDDIDAAKSQLQTLQATLATLTAEIARVKAVIHSEKTAFDNELRTGIAAVAVDLDDLSRLSREIEEKRAEAVRVQNETAAAHQRCEAIARDCNKLEKMLG